MTVRQKAAIKLSCWLEWLFPASRHHLPPDPSPTAMRFLSACLLVAISVLPTLAADLIASGQWPQFRGPGGDGIAGDQSVPIKFSDTENVTWKTELPGRAWSSPVVADGVIWVTTALERTPSEEERIAMLRSSGIEEKKFKQLAIAKSIELKLVAIDFETGSIQRTIDLTTIAKPDPIHSVNSYASPTPVIDGNQYLLSLRHLRHVLPRPIVRRSRLATQTATCSFGRPR